MSDPPIRSVTSWSTLYGVFPVWRQEYIDEAARWLLATSPLDPHYCRAQAWLSYVCTVAAMDKWSTAGEAWGSLQNVDREGLIAAAKAFDESARRLMPPDYSYRYDVIWAGAYTRQFREAPEDTNDWDDEDLESSTLNPLRAEVADCLTYLGRTGRAIVKIKLAIANLEGGGSEVPDWYRWVLAWAEIGAAATYAYSDARCIQRANNAIAALNLMGREYVGDIPWDFDSVVVRMMARRILDGRKNTLLWGQYNDVVRARKGLDWYLEDELQRSPFAPILGQRLKQLMVDSLPARPPTRSYGKVPLLPARD
jgi:hypothetical protein